MGFNSGFKGLIAVTTFIILSNILMFFRFSLTSSEERVLLALLPQLLLILSKYFQITAGPSGHAV